MVTWLTQDGAAQSLVLALAKITALLAFAWLVHHALARANPRWRVLLWRGALIANVMVVFASPQLPRWFVEVETPPVVAPAPAPQWQPAAEFAETSIPPEETASVQPAPPVEPPQPTLTKTLWGWMSEYALPLVTAAWLLGVALLVTRSGLGVVGLRRLLNSAEPAPPALQSLLHRVHTDLRIARPLPQLRVLDEVVSPYLTGLTRPVIVLPRKMLQPEYARDLPAVLAHELAHLQSRDHVWSFALRAGAHALWFHPLAWRAPAAHADACEAVCDAVAADYAGTQPYTQTLARAALDFGATRVAAPGVPMIRRAAITRRLHALRRGITAVALDPRRRRAAVLAGIALALVAGAVHVRAVTTAAAQEASSDAAAPMSVDKPQIIVSGEWNPGPVVGDDPLVVINSYGQDDRRFKFRSMRGRINGVLTLEEFLDFLSSETDLAFLPSGGLDKTLALTGCGAVMARDSLREELFRDGELNQALLDELLAELRAQTGFQFQFAVDSRGSDGTSSKAETKSEFGPVHEGWLHDNDVALFKDDDTRPFASDLHTRPFVVDFDTGKFAHGDNWGIVSPPYDALADISGDQKRLIAWDVVVLPVDDAWRATPEQITGLLDGATPVSNTIITADPPLPRGYVIQTREGARGVLEILEYIDPDVGPARVRLRFKMLSQQASDSGATNNSVIAQTEESVEPVSVAQVQNDEPGSTSVNADLDEPALAAKRDEAVSAGNLTDAFDWEMKRVELRAREGHLYKDKISLDTVYEAWKAEKSPSDAQIREMYEQAQAYAREHADDTEYAWRIQHALAVMARDLDRYHEALTHYADALDAYPNVQYPDPSKHSKFQHLVYDRAMLLWDRDGYDAAKDWALGLFRTDPRFQYFYSRQWVVQLYNEGDNQKTPELLRGIRDAYRYRLDNLPTHHYLTSQWLTAVEQELAQLEEKEAKPEPDAEFKPDEEDWRVTFNRIYSLDDGEVVKRISPPFPSERERYQVALNLKNAEGEYPKAMFFRWIAGTLKHQGNVWAEGEIELQNVASMLLGAFSHHVQGSDEILEALIQGDWIVRDESSPAEVAAGLQAVVRRDLGIDTSISASLEEMSPLQHTNDEAEQTFKNVHVDISRKDSELEGWRAEFNRIYSLEDDEVLKRIAPPFPPERDRLYQNEIRDEGEPERPTFMTFRWRDNAPHWQTCAYHDPTMYDVLRLTVGIESYEVEDKVSTGLNRWKNTTLGPLDLPVPGDWLIRPDVSRRALMAALERILRDELSMDVAFEHRDVERDCIVVSGDFEPVSANLPTIQLIALDLPLNQIKPQGRLQRGNFEEFLNWVSDLVGKPILKDIDISPEQAEVRFDWRSHDSVTLLDQRNWTPEEHDESIHRLLASLSQQTSLAFTQEVREMPVWFVTLDEQQP